MSKQVLLAPRGPSFSRPSRAADAPSVVHVARVRPKAAAAKGPAPRKVTPAPVRKARKAPANRRTPAELARVDRLARRLEADWEATLRRHEALVHRRFHDLRAAARRRGPLSPRQAAEVLKALEPRLKPKKGRVKDLRRVESALDDALARLA